MYSALEARRVQGTTSAVCEIDSNQAVITVDPMGQDSAHITISYPGKLIKWEALNIKCESFIIAKDSGSEKGFSSIIPRRISLPTVQEEEANVADNASYQCNEPGCSSVLANFEVLQDHINFGKNGYNSKDNEGFHDRLRREWSLKFATMSFEPVNKTSNTQDQASYSRHDWTPESQGWALQKSRGGGTRFSENVKAYLQSRFDTGELTGRKADPNQISKEMPVARNMEGTRKFKREEWLSTTQIQSFVARLAAKKRKGQTKGQENALVPDDAIKWDWSTLLCMMGSTSAN